MSKNSLRLECLRLAVGTATAGESMAPMSPDSTESVLQRAADFYEFVTGGYLRPVERLRD
jgi:hypothetical protein